MTKRPLFLRTSVLLPLSLLVVPVWWLVGSATAAPRTELDSPLGKTLEISLLLGWIGLSTVAVRASERWPVRILLVIVSAVVILGEAQLVGLYLFALHPGIR